MRDRIYRAVRRLFTLALLSLLGGLLGATLVRFAPGYGFDERALDPRLSQQTLESIRAANGGDSSLLAYYGRFLKGAIHGDFGNSQWLQRPIASLVRERFPLTLRSVLLGTLLAWTAALAASLTISLFPSAVLELSGTLLAGVFIALPIAVVGVLAVYTGASVSVAVAAVLFPKLFRYLRNLLAHASAQPHVLAARARGIGRGRILSHHLFPNISLALFALLGLSLSMAFGAAIPIEALCDSPGIGQLAWQAALNRDLPLIINLTMLTTIITVAANWLMNVGERSAT